MTVRLLRRPASAVLLQERSTSPSPSGAGGSWDALVDRARAGEPLHVDEHVERIFQSGDLARGLGTQHGTEDGWVAQAFRLVARGIENLARALEGLRATNSVLFWILIVVLLLIVAALLAHIAYTMYRGLTARASPPSSGIDDQALRGRQSLEHREEARRLASAGNFTEALRHWTLALLSLIEESHLLPRARFWTTREVSDRLRAKLGDGAGLTGFVSGAERYSYGGGALDAARYQPLAEQAEHLLASLERIRE